MYFILVFKTDLLLNTVSERNSGNFVTMVQVVTAIQVLFSNTLNIVYDPKLSSEVFPILFT